MLLHSVMSVTIQAISIPHQMEYLFLKIYMPVWLPTTVIFLQVFETQSLQNIIDSHIYLQSYHQLYFMFKHFLKIFTARLHCSQCKAL